MKTCLALLITMALCLSLAACTSAEHQNSIEPTESTSGEQSEAPAVSPSEEQGETPLPEPSEAMSQAPSAASQPPAQSTAPTQSKTPTPSKAPAQTPAPSGGQSTTNPEIPSANLAVFYNGLSQFHGDEAPAMMEVEGAQLEHIYPGLSGIQRKQTVLRTAKMSSIAAEVALVEVASSADVQAVKTIFQQRINTQVGTDGSTPGAWYPETVENWQNNARIVVNGNCVMLVVSQQVNQVMSAFNALF